MQWHSITPTTTRTAPCTTRLAAGRKGGGAAATSGQRPAASSQLCCGALECGGERPQRVVVLRLPAASRQQPALLWRARMWRRTTLCSGTPSRPPPRVQPPAQPGWPLAAGRWPLVAHTATTLRPISPRHASIGRSLAAGRTWRRTTPCSGTPSRPPPRVQHPAQPGWPLAAGRWQPTPPQRSDPSHLDTLRFDGHWPLVERGGERPMQWHSITPTTTRTAPGTTRLAAGRWPLVAHTATTHLTSTRFNWTADRSHHPPPESVPPVHGPRTLTPPR